MSSFFRSMRSAKVPMMTAKKSHGSNVIAEINEMRIGLSVNEIA